MEREMLTKEPGAEMIIKTHVLWSLGAGLMPVPLLDIVAVTAIQIDMLRQLAAEYKVDFSASTGKMFVAALTGGTFARLGASMVKAIPGVGSVEGGISMSVMSGASTYAVGQVARSYFVAGADLSKVDVGEAKKAYSQEFERGKQVVSDLEKEKEAASDTYKAAFEGIASLEKLMEKGLVTQEEFEALKSKLLERLSGSAPE
jgi:uncharacterized protein (DUF697 family)